MAHQDRRTGGVIHTYQKYDPQRFPSPTQPPPDLVSSAFEHLLTFGNTRQLTPEELARAIRIDPSQIAGLGPSLDAYMSILLERRRKILQNFETDTVVSLATENFVFSAEDVQPPLEMRKRYIRAIQTQQLYELERLWYAFGNDRAEFARQLVQVMERLGEKYQVDELAADYDFTGRTPLTVSEALQIKEELTKIDELLKQLEEAQQTAQIGILDMESLAEFMEPGEMDQLSALQQQVADYIREMAKRQGLSSDGQYIDLSPQAYQLFQGKLLKKIFSNLTASRTGRHQGDIVGEGAVEMQQTKQYEFGDSLTHLDISQTFINAMLRHGPGLPVPIRSEDIEVHRTRNTPKCASTVVMDMSGSMRYDGQYINVKRMALALDGLIRNEFPGDYLRFVEMFTFAKVRSSPEIVNLLPKPVTITDPWVRLKADMSRDGLSEHQIHPHFTNIQHGLHLSRQLLSQQDTLNRQIILITDGLPTAHFEGTWLYMLYPPDPQTELATLREAALCARENITINIFLVPSWSQTEEDVRFAHRMAQSTTGRVFFTAGRDLDRYVVWDYLNRRREIVA